jgi:hypothetical protein
MCVVGGVFCHAVAFAWGFDGYLLKRPVLAAPSTATTSGHAAKSLLGKR